MQKYHKIIKLFGIFLVALGFIILFFTFKPVITQEISYKINQNNPQKINPVNTDFSIIIPKINANSKVIQDVDPFNQLEYQVALTKGVAHAKNTALPGEMGNIFIFSHSAVDFYEAQKFNSIFYLLNKLDSGDSIEIYFKDEQYAYQVTNKTIVNPSEVNYLSPLSSGNQTLTLMTCWPPGTSLKRLLVVAEKV